MPLLGNLVVIVALRLLVDEKTLSLSTSLPDGSYKPTSGKKSFSFVDTVMVMLCPVSPLNLYPSAPNGLVTCPVTVSPLLMLGLDCTLLMPDMSLGNDPGMEVMLLITVAIIGPAALKTWVVTTKHTPQTTSASPPITARMMTNGLVPFFAGCTGWT